MIIFPPLKDTNTALSMIIFLSTLLRPPYWLPIIYYKIIGYQTQE